MFPLFLSLLTLTLTADLYDKDKYYLGTNLILNSDFMDPFIGGAVNVRRFTITGWECLTSI